MVDLHFAIRDYRRDPKLPAPNPSDLVPPGFEPDYSFTDPFPDFDVIKEWILEPDCSGMSNEENRRESGDPLSNTRGFSADTVGDVEVRLVGEDLGKVSLVGASESVVIDKKFETVNDNGDGIDRKVGGGGSPAVLVQISGDFTEGSLVVDSDNGQNIDGPLVNARDEAIGLDLVQSRIGATDDSFSTALSIADKGPLSEIDAQSDGIVNKGDRSHSLSEFETDDSSSSSNDEEDDVVDDDASDNDIDIEEENVNVNDEEEFEEGEIRDLHAKKRGVGMNRPVKCKNEFEILPQVPPVDVTLESHHQTLPVGVIISVLDNKVIVEGLEKHNPLSEGSILWITETRSPLGIVDEIFGPVKNPYYIVRYNSNEEVPAEIQEGKAVSFVAEFASYVLNDQSLYKKGYDASGENDEEVSDEDEFSDDEKEAEYKRMQRKPKRGMDDQKNRNRWYVDRKNGNQEFDQKIRSREEFRDQKRDENNGHRVGKNNHLASRKPPVPVAMDPPSLIPFVPVGPSHAHPNQLQMAPITGQYGCTNCACSIGNGPIGMIGTMATPFSHVPLQPGYFGAPPKQVLPMGSNMVWPNGMPYQQQQYMGLPNGAQTNGMPCQQNQHSGLLIGAQTNGMPYQQQYTGLPNGAQMNGMSCQQNQHTGLPDGAQTNGMPHQQQQHHQHQHQQQHMVLPNGTQPTGMPCKQHHHPGLPIAAQANGMPSQQQQQHMGLPSGASSTGEPHHHEQQHTHSQESQSQPTQQQQLQVFSDPCNSIWTGGMPCQHQFDPGQGPPSAVWTNGPLLNQAAASSCMSLPGFVGQVGFNQTPFGMGLLGNHGAVNNLCLGQFPPASGGNFSAPQQFNPGKFSGDRGRASSQHGRFSGRRGRQPRPGVMDHVPFLDFTPGVKDHVPYKERPHDHNYNYRRDDPQMPRNDGPHGRHIRQSHEKNGQPHAPVCPFQQPLQFLLLDRNDGDENDDDGQRQEEGNAVTEREDLKSDRFCQHRFPDEGAILIHSTWGVDCRRKSCRGN